MTDKVNPDHPTWIKVDAALERIWAKVDDVSLQEDNDWLDEMRSGWEQRLEDLYGGLDSWE